MMESSIRRSGKLTIDYRRSLDEMLKDNDFFGGDTAQKIETEGEGEICVETALLKFEFSEFDKQGYRKSVPAATVVSRIKEAGWECARIEHLLAFARKNSNSRRRQYTVVAVGTSVAKRVQIQTGKEWHYRDPYVPSTVYPYISEHIGNGRAFGFISTERVWGPELRYLAFRTQS